MVTATKAAGVDVEHVARMVFFDQEAHGLGCALLIGVADFPGALPAADVTFAGHG